MADTFYIPKYRNPDDSTSSGGSSGGSRSSKDGFYTPSFKRFTSSYAKDDEEEQLKKLKEQAKKPTTTKVNVGGKEVELDEATKQNWFKLNEEAKKRLKDTLGEETFNQLKSTLDKEAPKQGIFDKIKDRIDANSAADKFRRIQEGRSEDYRTDVESTGKRAYTNPLQGAFMHSIGTPGARSINTIAGAVGKFGQGVSDVAGYVAAGSPEEKRKALERMKRSEEDIAFSGQNAGIFGAGANIKNAEELNDKKKLAGASLQTGTDLYSIIPQGKAVGIGLAGMSAGKRLGANVAENVVTGLASEGGRQLKEGQFDAKALATGAAMDAAIPLGAFGAGRVLRGATDSLGATKAVDTAVREVPSTKAAIKDPSFTQKFFDGGDLGYDTIAQTGGLGSFADKAVNKAWNSVKNSVTDTKGGKKVFGGIANAFDDQSGILALTKMAESKSVLKEGATDMIRKKAGDLRRSAAEAQTFVNNLPEGQSLRGAIRDIAQTDFKGDLRASQDSFKDFWSARSELELENLYNNTGGKSGRLLDPAKKANAEQVIAQFQNPKYAEAFDALTGVYRKVLDDKLASGQITQKTYDSLVDLPYNYSRQQRVLQDWELDNNGNKSGGFGGIQKRDKTDTARELLDPIETMIAYTQRHFADKTMNDYKKQVIGALEAAGEAKRVKMDSTPSGPRESLYIGGEKVEYDVPREVKKAFEAWSPKEIGAIGNLARASNNIFKYGTTGGNVGFIFRNLTVDTISALINSPTPVRMAMEMPVAWAQALGIPTGKVSKALRDITEEQLGNNSTRVAQYHKPGSAKSAGREFVKQDASLKAKGMNIAQNKGEFLQAMKKVDDALGRVEIATRKAQFAALYKKLKKQGYDDASAIQAAGLQAREVTTEFAAGGSLAKTINLASPYFNTKMQVPRTLARNLEKRPVTTALKMATLVGAPMMGLTLWNTETPEKLAIYNDLDERTKEDYFVFIGPNAKKGEDGKWSGVTLVRKPNDTSALFEGFRKYIENVANNEPEEHTTWLQVLKDTGGALKENAPVPVTVNQAANALPPLAKTGLEDATNRSIYYGTDLVPEYIREQSDNPAEQSYKNYSRTSKFLGGLLGKSPITIDNYIRGNLGEVGSQLQNLTDRATGGREGRINEEGETFSDVGGRSPVESVTRNFDAVRGDEVKRQFWEQVGGKESPAQRAKNRASKKVTAAVDAKDYVRAARLAQEYNETVAGRVTPFLKKYQNSPSWDPDWDEYINKLFISDKLPALKRRGND